MKRFVNKQGRHGPARVWALCLLLALLVLPPALVSANQFGDYQDYANPDDQQCVVLPEITGGWFAAVDYFPDNGNGDTIGSYETRGRALVANDRWLYLQKNYGAGAGKGTWSPSSASGVVGDNMPGGYDNWVIVAEVTPGVGYPGNGSMDPSFIHISPDGTKVALGLGYAQPMLVFPVSMLDPDNPPLLNYGNYGEYASSGVTLFPWGSLPVDGVQYYEAEWIPDPVYGPVTNPDGTLDPSAPDNNKFLAINTDRGWDPGPDVGVGSVVELLDTTNAANRPVVTIYHIGYGPLYSASADVAVDLYGNLITGQGYDYNNTSGPSSETGQIKIFSVNQWMGAYSGDPAAPNPIEYDNTTNIIADKVLSAAAMGVDKYNNLHVGGGDVVSGVFGEMGFAAVIHADALQDGLDDAGPVNEADPTYYTELQPDQAADDSATFVVYNPWAESINLFWNPRNWGQPQYGIYDGWYPGVTPIATSYYTTLSPDGDGDGIMDGSDNAYQTPNAGQEDADGDGWGNAADADFNNDNVVNFNDYSRFRGDWLSNDPVTDMDSNGVVNFSDYSLFRSRWLQSGPYY